MFKYYIIALLFLLILIFAFLFWADRLDKNDKNKDVDAKSRGEKHYNGFFRFVEEMEARLSDIEVLDTYFDGVAFEGIRCFDDCICSYYSYVDANDVTKRDYVDKERTAKLQERIKRDIVKFFDRNYSLFIGPGFTFKDYIEVDTKVYRRVVVKRITIL